MLHLHDIIWASFPISPKGGNRRKGTPLEGLRTPIYVIVMVMAMYMCGVGKGMIAAVTGKQEKIKR